MADRAKAVRFGNRIAAARKAMGMTQSQLADRLGVTNRAVSAWERGRTETLLASTCFALADALSVNARWIVMGDGPMMPGLDLRTPQHVLARTDPVIE